VIPFLRVIFQNDPKMRENLAKWLGLDEEMVAFLSSKK